MARTPVPDVIVLLPGITGSVLARDGKDIWAVTGGSAWRALTSLGRSITDLALTEDPPDVDDLGDGVTAPRVMPDLHLIPGLWTIDGYGKIAARLQETLDLTPGQNYFDFAYDWRRDNRVAARALARATHDWLSAWRASSGNADAKLILVGHSMGGLVCRYFLECLDGWKDTRLLVTFGTPYRGSANALGFLANGMAKKLLGLTVADLSPLLRSFTSVYQLLPIYPCYDGGDGTLARVAEADGVPNVDRARAADALAFHREIEAAVDGHLKDQAYLDAHYEILPIVGTFQPTNHSGVRRGDAVEMLRTIGGTDPDGDSTVPLPSATPLELSEDPREMYANERHGSLQNNDGVLVQLMQRVMRDQRSLGSFKATMNMGLGLDVEDVYLPEEPVSLAVTPEDPGARLTAVVQDAAKGTEVARSTAWTEDGAWRRTEIPPLPEGTYRVTVSAVGPIDPVSDLFVVPGAAG
jgi:pimeloyl-ACP methyl ester carboxylesterase